MFRNWVFNCFKLYIGKNGWTVISRLITKFSRTYNFHHLKTSSRIRLVSLHRHFGTETTYSQSSLFRFLFKIMKFKPTTARRQECLRIRVLRKTVTLKDLKRKPIVIELNTETGQEKFKTVLEKSRQVNECFRKKIEAKTPVKRNQDNENRVTLDLFNYNIIAANFSRKFGIERKIITPKKKEQSNSNGMRKGKGGKFLYMWNEKSVNLMFLSLNIVKKMLK